MRPRKTGAAVGLMLVLGITWLLGACQKLETPLCDLRLPPSRIVIDAPAPSFAVGTSATARTLGDAHGDDGEMITYGLTSARSQAGAEVSLHVMRLPGGVCARPDVTVHLAYRPMTVEIAHELAPGSCGYETVLGHEMKHVDVFRQTLASSAATLKDEIDHRGLNQARIYPDAARAEAAMQSLQDDWLVPRAEELLGRAAQAQQAVDNAAEYQRVANACPDTPLLSGQSAPQGLHF